MSDILNFQNVRHSRLSECLTFSTPRMSDILNLQNARLFGPTMPPRGENRFSPMRCIQFYNYKTNSITFGSRCIVCSYLLSLILHITTIKTTTACPATNVQSLQCSNVHKWEYNFGGPSGSIKWNTKWEH